MTPKLTTALIIAAKNLGAGFATVALAGVGAGIGVIFAGFLLALARNPQLKDELFGYVILGFALTEAIGLFALMVVFMLLFT